MRSVVEVGYDVWGCYSVWWGVICRSIVGCDFGSVVGCVVRCDV